MIEEVRSCREFVVDQDGRDGEEATKPKDVLIMLWTQPLQYQKNKKQKSMAGNMHCSWQDFRLLTPPNLHTNAGNPTSDGKSVHSNVVETSLSLM